MELSPRLLTIAGQVPQNARLVDVGTDHGYLPVWLLLNGQIQNAIATDLRVGPLNHAIQTAQEFGQCSCISFRLCNGLADISEDEADVIVIAGMGGETIASILKAAPWTKKDKLLLLQPMTGFPELRQWLQCNEYSILKEHIAREGKYLYSIWTVRAGHMPSLTPAELWAGQQNDDLLRRDYLDLMIKKVKKALNGQMAARTPNQTVIASLNVTLTGLQQMKEELYL